MSAPGSISYTSSYSDSGRSGISTPSSEFVPSKLYLLSPHFIDGALLEAFTSKLEKGYGDKILLSVAHKGPFDVKDVQAAVVRLGKAIPDACPADKQWVKVPEGKTCGIAPMSLWPEPSFAPRQCVLPRRWRTYPTRGGVVRGRVRPVTRKGSYFGKCHMEGKWITSRLTLISFPTQTTPAEALNIFSSSGLRVVFSVSSGTDGVLPSALGGGHATLYLLERPQVCFPPLPSIAPFGVPTPADWRTLWAAWDLVTLGMIPPAMLHQKPIDLRHKCLFYIGHIPTLVRD